MNKVKNKFAVLLRIAVPDKSKPMQEDSLGNKYTPVIWKPVKEINLGSLKNPNKSIVSFDLKVVPLVDVTSEKKKKHNIFDDILRGDD